MELLTIIFVIGGLLVGAGASYFLVRPKSKLIEEAARREAERTRKNAERESERILTDARKHAGQLREDVRREEEQLRGRLEKMQAQFDERIQKREEVLEQKIEKAEQARDGHEKSAQDLEAKKSELQKSLDSHNEVLEKISKMSKDDAKKELLERVEKEMSNELAEVQQRRVDLMRQAADEEASNIIAQSIQRFAAPVTSEATITVVKLESDTLKGKIIGREGRNINAFEMMTGVDLIIDDTPGTVTISSFDLFRRYIPKLVLEDLLKDGRIHP